MFCLGSIISLVVALGYSSLLVLHSQCPDGVSCHSFPVNLDDPEYQEPHHLRLVLLYAKRLYPFNQKNIYSSLLREGLQTICRDFESDILYKYSKNIVHQSERLINGKSLVNAPVS